MVVVTTLKLRKWSIIQILENEKNDNQNEAAGVYNIIDRNEYTMLVL